VSGPALVDDFQRHVLGVWQQQQREHLHSSTGRASGLGHSRTAGTAKQHRHTAAHYSKAMKINLAPTHRCK
jgi:hypothetical protein